MKIALIIIAAVLSTSICNAAELGFRSMNLGINQENAEKLMEEYSVNNNYEKGDKIFYTIIKDKVMTIAPTFHENELISLSIFFESNEYPDILTAFEEKYGKPTDKHRQVLTNLFGASIDGSVAIWKRKDGRIVLSQRTEHNVKKGIALITSSKYKALNDQADKIKAASPGL